MKIQFVDQSQPANRASQRQRHAHAAREAHARTRRLRTAEYQAQQQLRAGQDGAIASTSSSDAALGEALESGPEEKAILPTVPLPSPVGGILGSAHRDPFDAFAVPFKPVEHFLLDHYVQAVLPDLNAQCPVLSNPRNARVQMDHDWVRRLALVDTGSISGIFLAACRHLSTNGCVQHHDHVVHMATEYKLTCIRSLNEAISTESSRRRDGQEGLVISDATITKVLLLAMDEIALGDFSTTLRHLRGAAKMVELNGGSIDHYLGQLLHELLGDKSLLRQGGDIVEDEAIGDASSSVVGDGENGESSGPA
ncbi:hypothetical protein B0H63DRAFT_521847 [Podospora didyma]|uniref:Uncharacterized protein n=1 Tax=Podospora didyma TaxID=330526 RepID=A0AAE0NUB2_9PEZI|nr:hypothetical protein B0H63DRAFT_521847 [Podospora didyma]